jgi:hypothetical protein
MNFEIVNGQEQFPIDEAFWKRAFNHGARELEIGHFHASVICCFVVPKAERKIKFTQVFNAGSTGSFEWGACFYVTSPGIEAGQMVRTFFHETTHVKQYLMRELINKPRSKYTIWKGEKWDRKEYAFAPWEGGSKRASGTAIPGVFAPGSDQDNAGRECEWLHGVCGLRVRLSQG